MPEPIELLTIIAAAKKETAKAVKDALPTIADMVRREVDAKEIKTIADIAATIKGDKGDKGDNGLDGKDGLDGRDGKDGANGKDGKDGKDAIAKDGKDGKDGRNGADLQRCNTHDKRQNMNMKFLDKATIGTVNRTSEGYVTARAKAVRTGVQDYLASELGLIGNHRVRVYRPEDEVFSKDSVAGFAHAPVTNDHPKELVTADNWRELAVGEVGANVMRDGEFLALDLILKDAAAIKAFDGGKKELSAGYTAEIEFVDNNPDYDAVMKNIRINHLALVDKGRAGSEARIGDSAANQWGVSPLTTSNEVPKMDTKAVAIGDKAYTVLAADADQLAKAFADKDTAIGELKAKLADAESKILTDEQMQAKVKDLADAMARRESVKAKFGDEAVKDASDAEIAGMFKIIDKVPAQDDTARKALADAMKSKAEEKDDPWAKINAKKKGDK